MSRTLGFIAGLTVPAGLYYVSVLHLQGTTNHISNALHEQSLKLDDPTRCEPVVFEPRHPNTLSARIRQGWNDGIERGVRFIQENDWPETARQTGKAITNLTKAGWEPGREKLEDSAQHAGEAVGSALHSAKTQAIDLGHEASVRGGRLAHDVEAEAHRLRQVAQRDAVEAKEILREAERKAEVEYELRKAQTSQKSSEVKEEVKRQAEEANEALSNASHVISSKFQEVKSAASAMLRQGKRAAKDSMEDGVRQIEQATDKTNAKVNETWIVAQDRYDRLMHASEQQVDMKFKELQESFGSRRIGFTKEDDPTGAAKNVAAAEKYNRTQPVEGTTGASSKGVTVADVLEATADF